MSSIPVSYEDLRAHLAKVLEDPASPLDLRLIDLTKVELTENTAPDVIATLLKEVSQLLPVLQTDPTPLTELCIKATAHSTFTDIRSIDPPIDLLAGLEAPSSPINLLALSLLGKASKTPSETAMVAGDSELATSLVKRWLSTPSPDVAESALDVICQLLEVDLGRRSSAGECGGGHDERAGQGLMWRRMFTDKRVYGLLFSICSLDDGGPESLSKRDKTVAQGRLLNFLVKAGTLHWCMISRSQIKEIEAKHNSTSLLHYAACNMVDKDDLLMHITLLDFFRDLLAIDAPGLMVRTYIQSQFTFSSPALDFLISMQLHEAILDSYLHDSSDNLDMIYLKDSVAAYVARYAELYPNHFLQNPQSMLDGILSSIHNSLSISPQQYALDLSPSDQLMVLSSLPRIMLVEATTRQLNPMSLVPTRPGNKAALNALAKIFHGPVIPETADSMQPFSSGQTPTDWGKESAAARILYYLYVNAHADMWRDITQAADVLASPDTALASISFIKDIITANWHESKGELLSSPAGSRFILPSEAELEENVTSPTVQVAPSGIWAVLSQPAFLTVIPYLFKAPRTYGEFVAGGAADSTSIVWRVATAKFDALVALDNRIRDIHDAEGDDLEQIKSRLTRLLNQGPLGGIDRTATSVGTTGM